LDERKPNLHIGESLCYQHHRFLHLSIRRSLYKTCLYVLLLSVKTHSETLSVDVITGSPAEAQAVAVLDSAAERSTVEESVTGVRG
jgi:hypothetical protein